MESYARVFIIEPHNSYWQVGLYSYWCRKPISGRFYFILLYKLKNINYFIKVINWQEKLSSISSSFSSKKIMIMIGIA